MQCLCTHLYMDQTKNIFDHFICIWKLFLSLFVFMFCAYFVFHCFKHVLCWKIGVKVFRDPLVTCKNFRDSSRNSPVAQCKSRVNPETFVTHSQLTKIFATHPVVKRPEIDFLKGFSWKTYFKHFPFSLKPLFHYFYIKPQSIWMVFHSINISEL